MKVTDIFALDLGSNTGFAYRAYKGNIVAGTWEFPAKKKGANCCVIDPRLLLFREKLLAVIETFKPAYFVYEDVKFVRSQAQAHLWSGFRAVLWLVSQDHKIPCLCVPVQTLKKFAVKGNADKDDMALALMDKLGAPFVAPLSNDAVDATWLLLWAETQVVCD